MVCETTQVAKRIEMALYLTKSRFKLALECPTKLYYANSKNGYFDKNKDNDFLQSLADGGNQVGELAKFKYHPDPVGAAIAAAVITAAYIYTKAKMNNEPVPEMNVYTKPAILNGIMVYFIVSSGIGGKERISIDPF